MIHVREARIITNAETSAALPGYGLFLEACVGGVWKTYWLRLDGGKT